MDSADWDALAEDDQNALEIEELARELYLEFQERAGVINIRWWETQTDATKNFFRMKAARRWQREEQARRWG